MSFTERQAFKQNMISAFKICKKRIYFWGEEGIEKEWLS